MLYALRSLPVRLHHFASQRYVPTSVMLIQIGGRSLCSITRSLRGREESGTVDMIPLLDYCQTGRVRSLDPACRSFVNDFAYCNSAGIQPDTGQSAPSMPGVLELKFLIPSIIRHRLL
jgi:hypothetical protein